MEVYIISILILSTLAFIFALGWTPMLTHFLYKYKVGKQIRNNGNTPIFSKMHAHKSGTPTMGGVLIWVTLLIFLVVFYYLDSFTQNEVWSWLNFFSREETLLPLGVLLATALVGLVDDWLDVRGKGVWGGGGLNMKYRLLIYTIVDKIKR